MPIEAPISKFAKTNIKIYIGACLVAAVVFAYDGYLSKYKWSGRYSFYQEHVIDNGGTPNAAMKFNIMSPPVFLGAAVLFTVYLFIIKKNKLIADENELVFSNKKRIAYDSIQKINKTYFDKKGYFVITYENESGKQVQRKINDRKYDNLAPILDHLVAKIS